METIAIFVDVQNIYYTCQQRFGKNFDYNAFWAQASAGRKVSRAFAYAIDRGDQKQRQFQNILRAIGFELRLKPFIQRSDGSAKGDWDVGITIDALEFGAQADTCILLSGDGDFSLLVDHLRQRQAKRVEVYGVADLSAQSLINSANQFIAIEAPLLLGRAKP